MRDIRASLVGTPVNDRLRLPVVEDFNFAAAQIRNCLTVNSHGSDVESDELGGSRLSECWASNQKKDAEVSPHRSSAFP